MKSIGVVRKVDELGRIVLPMELRRTYGIDTKDPIEIFVDGEQIVLKKYQPLCVFCGESGRMVDFHGKNICGACVKELENSTQKNLVSSAKD